MRTAFTMIELIFVIVILGILATVAIPKLTATRDDAIISKMMMDVGHGITELGNFATSQGSINEDLTTMSNILKKLVDTGKATKSNGRVDIKMGNVSDCISVVTVSEDGGSSITVIKGTAGSDELCKRLQDAMPIDGFTLALTGARVIF